MTDSTGPEPSERRKATFPAAVPGGPCCGSSYPSPWWSADYLLPFDRSATWGAVTLLVIGLLVLIGLIAFQVRAITRSLFPGLRAIEALATSFPLFLLMFTSDAHLTR